MASTATLTPALNPSALGADSYGIRPERPGGPSGTGLALKVLAALTPDFIRNRGEVVRILEEAKQAPRTISSCDGHVDATGMYPQRLLIRNRYGEEVEVRAGVDFSRQIGPRRGHAYIIYKPGDQFTGDCYFS